MPTRNENSVAAGRPRPRTRAIRMVDAEREVPGKTAASIWARPTATAIAHVTWLPRRRPLTRCSMARISTPPIRVAHATGHVSLGSESPAFFARRPPAAVIKKAADELQQVVARVRRAEPAQQIAHAPREHGEHREDGARLDHHVEQLRLRGQEAAVLGEEQVAGGRDGQEFRDAFDHAEQDDGEPVGHRGRAERPSGTAQPTMSSPPSTPITLPVIQYVSGCDRTTMARATSSVVVSRRCGFRRAASRENSP